MNIVEEFYYNNKNKKISVKNAAKILKLKKNNVLYMCYNSDKIRIVNPREVGSLKYKLSVFTFS